MINMLNTKSPLKINRIPQIRINSKYKGVMSNWWSINVLDSENVNSEGETLEMLDVNALEDIDEDLDIDAEIDEIIPLFMETSASHMILERTDPLSTYIAVRINSFNLKTELEWKHN